MVVLFNQGTNISPIILILQVSSVAVRLIGRGNHLSVTKTFEMNSLELKIVVTIIFGYLQRALVNKTRSTSSLWQKVGN